MDFTPISQLKLREAFASNSRFKGIVKNDDLLKELFECDNRGMLFVHDSQEDGHTIYVRDTARIGRDKVFVITNTAHKDVFLWHIDGVMYKKNTKCDCVVLDDASFNLIEFKANAENDTTKAMASNYEDAKNQLLATFQDVAAKCQSTGIDLTDIVKVEAYAVFNKTVPRNNALQKNVAASFLFATKGVRLKFENSKKL